MRTTLGRRILGLSGRLSLNVHSVSDIDGETTSKKLRPANFHLGSMKDQERTCVNDVLWTGIGPTFAEWVIYHFAAKRIWAEMAGNEE